MNIFVGASTDARARSIVHDLGLMSCMLVTNESAHALRAYRGGLLFIESGDSVERIVDRAGESGVVVVALALRRASLGR